LSSAPRACRLPIAIVGRIQRRLLQRGHAQNAHGVLMPAE